MTLYCFCEAKQTKLYYLTYLVKLSDLPFTNCSGTCGEFEVHTVRNLTKLMVVWEVF